MNDVQKICEVMIGKNNQTIAGVFVILCNILVRKNIISPEEMDKLLSSENIEKIRSCIRDVISEEREDSHENKPRKKKNK